MAEIMAQKWLNTQWIIKIVIFVTAIRHDKINNVRLKIAWADCLPGNLLENIGK